MHNHFRKEIQIRFREADPAGIAFFANIFDQAHDLFEEFIQQAGFTWKEWFASQDYIVPIRHTECTYHKPFKAGQKYDVVVSIAKLGNSSFTMKYLFVQNSHLYADVKMTHVFLSAQNKEKISIPAGIKTLLSNFAEEQTQMVQS